MKSKQDFATAQETGFHPARSQEKQEFAIDKQDYDHGKNDDSLHVQGHGPMQSTVVFRMGRCQSLFCQTVHIATMLERRRGSRVVREGLGLAPKYGTGEKEGGMGTGVLASSLLRTELIFLP